MVLAHGPGNLASPPSRVMALPPGVLPCSERLPGREGERRHGGGLASPPLERGGDREASRQGERSGGASAASALPHWREGVSSPPLTPFVGGLSGRNYGSSHGIHSLCKEDDALYSIPLGRASSIRVAMLCTKRMLCTPFLSEGYRASSSLNY